MNDETKALYRIRFKAYTHAHEQYTNRFPIDAKAFKKAQEALKAFADSPTEQNAVAYRMAYLDHMSSVGETRRRRAAFETAIEELDEVLR